MSERVHYGDNIFYLTIMIRVLNNAVKLNLDTEYFAEKIIEDTLFLDSTVQKIYESLKEHRSFIRREVHMHSLMKLKKSYGKFIEDLLLRDIAGLSRFDSVRPKLKRIAAAHFSDAKTIGESLDKVQEITIHDDSTSQDEMHFLMSPIETDDSEA